MKVNGVYCIQILSIKQVLLFRFYSDDEPKGINIHRQFLDKPEREQITWKTRFLQPEREDEKSLIKRANDLTERVI